MSGSDDMIGPPRSPEALREQATGEAGTDNQDIDWKWIIDKSFNTAELGRCSTRKRHCEYFSSNS